MYVSSKVEGLCLIVNQEYISSKCLVSTIKDVNPPTNLLCHTCKEAKQLLQSGDALLHNKILR